MMMLAKYHIYKRENKGFDKMTLNTVLSHQTTRTGLSDETSPLFEKKTIDYIGLRVKGLF